MALRTLPPRRLPSNCCLTETLRPLSLDRYLATSATKLLLLNQGPHTAGLQPLFPDHCPQTVALRPLSVPRPLSPTPPSSRRLSTAAGLRLLFLDCPKTVVPGPTTAVPRPLALKWCPTTSIPGPLPPNSGPVTVVSDRRPQTVALDRRLRAAVPRLSRPHDICRQTVVPKPCPCDRCSRITVLRPLPCDRCHQSVAL